MLSVVLALGSAVVLGSADFAGGLATKRAAAMTVVLWSNAAGLLTAAVFVGVLGATPTWADLGWGAVAGLAGGVGVILLYHALAHGVMSVVSPVTATASASLPVLVGLLTGDAVSVLTAGGLACGVLAIPCVSMTRGGGPSAGGPSGVGPAGGGRSGGGWRSRGVLGALAAGAGFGVFFVLVSRTGSGSGLWPLVAARCASVPVIAVLLPLRRQRFGLPGSTARLAVLSGVLDMLGNVLYLVAVRGGFLSVTGLLASLYPVSTLLLARVVLGERASRIQWAGVALALASVSLLALR